MAQVKVQTSAALAGPGPAPGAPPPAAASPAALGLHPALNGPPHLRLPRSCRRRWGRPCVCHIARPAPGEHGKP
ncbi:hypothetical protein CesoFtcFv8_025029 [Champsocephalus esox]|uniref:Uncharacterized protein n=1 Tax=Champsocephalus esox TaxID=159716 RepID=A0AAN8B3S1_9TELE|nr:hypothetical protein CesoFtcFv8_025029 [Champsocephalus esox]